MFYAGIDIGSTITKIVIANREEILATVIQRTGAQHRRAGPIGSWTVPWHRPDWSSMISTIS
jgi:sugar (pentulose or hexulose) kinase